MKISSVTQNNKSQKKSNFPRNNSGTKITMDNFSSMSFKGFKVPYSELKSAEFDRKAWKICAPIPESVIVSSVSVAKLGFHVLTAGFLAVAKDEAKIATNSKEIIKIRTAKLCDHYQADLDTKNNYLKFTAKIYDMIREEEIGNLGKIEYIFESLPGLRENFRIMDRAEKATCKYNRMLRKGIEDPEQVPYDQLLEL